MREMILMTDFWQGMFPAIFKKSEFEFTFWLTIIILCNLHCSKTYQLRQSTTSIGYNLVIPHGGGDFMTVNWISRIPTLSYMEMGFSRLKNPRRGNLMVFPRRCNVFPIIFSVLTGSTGNLLHQSEPVLSLQTVWKPAL